MTPDEWRDAAVHVVEDLLGSPWAFGDWLLAGEQLGLIDERTDILNSDLRFEGTEMAHYAYVSERIPTARRQPLPWSYHEAVARLPTTMQDMLLEVSQLEQWTLQEMRKAARQVAQEESG